MLPIPYVHQKHLYFVGSAALCACVCLCVFVCVCACRCMCVPCWHPSGALIGLIHMKRAVQMGKSTVYLYWTAAEIEVNP